MNNTFPLYASLKKYGNEKNDLTNSEKTIMVETIEKCKTEKQETIYALIRAYYLDNKPIQEKKKNDDILHYSGKELKKGIKYDVNNLPASLQHILFNFLRISEN